MSDDFNILKGGVRILRPCEYKQLHDAIPKIDHKDKLDALLYTGCRYTELKWLYEHPSYFKKSTILMPSRKINMKHDERYIRLNINGQRAIQFFLRSKTNLPDHPGWDENLKRWCKKAGIDPTGVCCKSTRKTWESWLITCYPNNATNIFLNQGHTEKTAMEYYLMLPFDDKDVEDMKFYTEGWI